MFEELKVKLKFECYEDGKYYYTLYAGYDVLHAVQDVVINEDDVDGATIRDIAAYCNNI